MIVRALFNNSKCFYAFAQANLHGYQYEKKSDLFHRGIDDARKLRKERGTGFC